MKKMINSRKFKSIPIILLMFIVIMVLYTFFVSIIFKCDYVNYFGFTYFNITSESMADKINTNDIVFVRLSNKKLKENDIITYKNIGGNIITHRIISIDRDLIITKGDANSDNDYPITRDAVIGKVLFIVSSKVLIEFIAILFIIICTISIIFYNKKIKRLFVKDDDSQKFKTNFDRVVVPEDIFSSPSDRKNEHSGLTVSIPMEEVLEIRRIIETGGNYTEKVLEVDEFDLDKNNVVTVTLSEDKREQEKGLIELINGLLKAKHDSVNVSKINKKWLEKYQYLYKISNIITYRDTRYLYECINHPSFKEIYDYDLDKIGLYENLRNKIYEMPIYIYLKILFLAILYNDEEFFDGVFKIMKYKIMIDKNDNFRTIDKNDTSSMRQVKQVIELMEKVSNKFDNKNVFELDKIKRLIKIEVVSND